MIKSFYNMTLPRFRSNEKKINKAINIGIYAEHLLVQKLCDRYVRTHYKSCQKELNKNPREQQIIVSMTTIPSRISALHYTLKSIFNQTLMPDRVILWITDLIENTNQVENALREEIDHGLEIRFVKDIRVHTKYYYAMKEFPNDLIITIDDDIMYAEDLFERLYEAHTKNPGCVIAARTHEITWSGKKINSYRAWHMLAPGVNNNAKSLIATGVGGVLYPPEILYKDWEDIDLFLRLSPGNDDIWLKVMETMAGTPVVKLSKYTRENFILGNTQAVALSNDNVKNNRNDVLMNQIVDYYGIDASFFSD